MKLPKRFYKEVTVTPENSILLDGKAVKTPGKRPLALPTRTLAEAIAEEWRGQGAHIDPATLLLTKLANTAIDRVAERLGNTRSVCRNCYIHPDLIVSWLEGTLADEMRAARKSFRKLPDADKNGIDEKKAINLMLAQPSLIKRPVLDRGGGKLIVGFKPEVYAEELAP